MLDRFDQILCFFTVHSLSGGPLSINVIYIEFEKNGNAENQTQDGWVGSVNATSVLCRSPLAKIDLMTSSNELSFKWMLASFDSWIIENVLSIPLDLESKLSSLKPKPESTFSAFRWSSFNGGEQRHFVKSSPDNWPPAQLVVYVYTQKTSPLDLT